MDEQDISVRIDDRDMNFRADVANINEAERTFDVVFATQNPVRKIDWSRYVEIDEILEISEQAIDATRIGGASGVPFLDNHSAWGGSASQLGVSEGWRIQGKKAWATLRMSDFPDDPKLNRIWHDIKTKIIRTVSVGYRVFNYEKKMAKEGSGGRDVFTATRWMPMEISTATIPADHGATIQRTAGDTKPEPPTNLVTVPFSTRAEDPIPAPIPPAPEPAAEADKSTRSNPIPVEKTPAELAAEAAAEQKRTADLAAATAAERTRTATIMTICRDHGLDSVREAEFIAKGNTPDEVRAAALEHLKAADPNKGATGGVGADRDADIAVRMADAILLRSGALVDSDMTPAQVGAAREFRSMDMMRMAETYVTHKGVNTRMLDGPSIAKAALGFGDHAVRTGGGGMLITDFPTALGSAMNRVLLKRYEMAPQTWKAFSTYRNAKDFRSMTSVQMGDAPRLELVLQGGEIRRGSMKDLGESYAISAYGKIVSLDWRTFINDDLGVFTDLPGAMAEEVAQLQSDIVYNLLLSNPVLGQDSTTVFHADHLNKAASGAALDNTSLKAATTRFMKQKSIGTPETAGRPLNLEPNLLIVGPDNYHAAYDIVYPQGVTLTTGSQTFKGRFEIIVDARITDSRFYLAVRPGRVKIIEYSLLDGKNFWTDKAQDFDTSGWNFKIETAFGATFLDFRGIDYTPTA